MLDRPMRLSKVRSLRYNLRNSEMVPPYSLNDSAHGGIICSSLMFGVKCSVVFARGHIHVAPEAACCMIRS